MKLQKLLFFAQLISLVKNDKFLFDDEFCAFENGMVMESVRLKYKNNLQDLLNYQRNDFSEEDLEVLELTKNIYGGENAEYWKKYLSLSNDENDYKNKKKSVVPNRELKKEIDNIKDVLDAYEIMNSKEYKEMEDLDY